MAFDHPFKTRSPKILEQKRELQAEWKKVYKPRTPKTGMSELLRTMDKNLQTKSYNSRSWANGHYGPVKAKEAAIKAAFKQDYAKGSQVFGAALAEWAKTLRQAYVELEKLTKKHKWLPKEDQFLKELLLDLKHESVFFLKLSEDNTNSDFFDKYVSAAKGASGSDTYDRTPTSTR